MGTTYFGPYHEEINTYDHGHVGYRARCECGWAGSVYPVPDPDPWDSDEADQEWMREHIQPMVEQARWQTWPAWSRREAERAASAAEAIAATASLWAYGPGGAVACSPSR